MKSVPSVTFAGCCFSGTYGMGAATAMRDYNHPFKKVQRPISVALGHWLMFLAASMFLLGHFIYQTIPFYAGGISVIPFYIGGKCKHLKSLFGIEKCSHIDHTNIP